MVPNALHYRQLNAGGITVGLTGILPGIIWLLLPRRWRHRLCRKPVALSIRRRTRGCRGGVELLRWNPLDGGLIWGRRLTSHQLVLVSRSLSESSFTKLVVDFC